MEEEKTLAEKPQKKPTLWDGALKMVKGENTNQLIEQFTAEMTLVAEGLCEDHPGAGAEGTRQDRDGTAEPAVAPGEAGGEGPREGKEESARDHPGADADGQHRGGRVGDCDGDQ